jgi:prepilin-type N-terminal cleavage/methylation domain-containing protein
MKRGNGFTLVELMTAIAILTVVVGATVGILIQAQRAANGVALAANTQENLRAGMHFLVRDLMQAGEGLPPGGILIPTNTAGNSNLNRPGIITPATTFPTSNNLLYVISPGFTLGQDATTVSATTNAVLNGGLATDIINVVYADNTLTDANGNYLNSASVASAASPVCGGTINASGTSVTMDPACFKMPGSPTPIAPGNLILFTNVKGTALEYVTSVSGQTINFLASDTGGSDPSGLNGLSAATYLNGTVAAINASTITTTITRVWMVTYYIDSTTNPSRPQLVRQVNYPGYPAGNNPANPPTPIADCIEDLSFSYDIVNSGAPAGTYTNGPGDAYTPLSWAGPPAGADTPAQFRAINVTLEGRSEYPFVAAPGADYFHNSLSTQVSVRNLAFVNQFNTKTTATPGP